MPNKTKVTFFFRKPQAQYFSIEKVFEQVIAHLPEQVEPTIYKLKNGTSGWLGRLKALFEARKNKGDINHITGDITFIALALPKKGLIVTYHDLESLADYKGWRFKILKYLWVTIPVKRARVVTAISYHTKEQLVKWTDCDSSKIVVIPNPLPDEITYSPKAFNKEKPTILIMGTKPNKNVEGILEAVGAPSVGLTEKRPRSQIYSKESGFHFAQHPVAKESLNDRREGSQQSLVNSENEPQATCHKPSSIRLIIVGKMTEQQQALVDKYKLEVENLVQVPYEEILDAYRRCDMLCFPSFYEGFGLPIIEAQATGRPVVTSNFGAMKEIAGGASLLVCPNNMDEIQQAIDNLIMDEEVRTRLIEDGAKNVARFKAGVVGKMYGEVYEGVGSRV
ncbi:glycosyltransferase family 4 protein [Saccharicrinis sp. GN24d3]|uniref:glycosyltransferase family 4 protein n=1 Tax=Saccharicrinis sp. GN24d3 TaxID=3458416 RepID=UPI004036D7AF